MEANTLTPEQAQQALDFINVYTHGPNWENDADGLYTTFLVHRPTMHTSTIDALRALAHTNGQVYDNCVDNYVMRRDRHVDHTFHWVLYRSLMQDDVIMLEHYELWRIVMHPEFYFRTNTQKDGGRVKLQIVKL